MVVWAHCGMCGMALLVGKLRSRFLNYKEEHRAKISVGDVTMTMVRDVTEAAPQKAMLLPVHLEKLGLGLRRYGVHFERL